MSTFDPRPLPEVIFIDDVEVIGPFCRHCGETQDFHAQGQCPAKIRNLLPPPSCHCHAVTDGRVPRVGEPVKVVTARGVAMATMVDKRKARRT